jgi:hypothetical protein
MMLLERVKNVAVGKTKPTFKDVWGFKPHPQGYWDYGFRK